MSDELARAILTIVFGALAGGITNSIAIWMLFHPYSPPRVGRWPLRLLQGAIPKNQARLARAIGRTVGTQLLSSDDLARTFADRAFRDAFDQRLRDFIGEMLLRERGSLREILSPPIRRELERILDEMVERALARFNDYLATPEFEAAVQRRAQELAEAIAAEPVADLLTPEREAAIAKAVEAWLGDAVESDEFERTVADYVERATASLLRPSRTFEEVLPVGLVASLEKAIAGYLPLAIHRLGRLLDDERARARFESAVHELLHRFLRDLKFYQRIVAQLIITEETVDRVLNAIERDGAEHLSEMLRDPVVQDAMARSVNEGIVEFLRRPVQAVLGAPEDAGVRDAQKTVVGWALRLGRDAGTRTFLIEKLKDAVGHAGKRTWGDLLERISPERLAHWVVIAARSDQALALYREAARRAENAILDRPIGVPADWLPADAAQRIESALADPLWAWLQTQVPTVVQKIDVAARVEDKVIGFPMERLEALVRGVTERELRLIVRLGYVLGAIVGLALVAIEAVLP
ncbi:MAG: DUF445 family protein [Gemmatimonadetes bacterium]|nr:DUF445 family protein [Gemmatimonadota bacterium]